MVIGVRIHKTLLDIFLEIFLDFVLLRMDCRCPDPDFSQLSHENDGYGLFFGDILFAAVVYISPRDPTI